MILSDNQLKERIDEIIVEGIGHSKIQPNSIDLHLDGDIKTMRGERRSHNHVLQPLEFVLGSTIEKVNIPLDLVGIVNGKSTLGRMGLMVHVTAGFIDSGFCGNITLELFNVSDEPIRLHAGMGICQLVLEQLTSPVSTPYGSIGLNSHYQGSKGTVISSKYQK